MSLRKKDASTGETLQRWLVYVLLRILVEAGTALSAEPSSRDQLQQEWARPVPVVPEALPQHPHDCDARIQTDQVGRAIISQKMASTAVKAGKPNANHQRNRR